MTDYDIIAYTDGACKGNPGIRGWGVILVSKEGSKELFGLKLIREQPRGINSCNYSDK